MSDILIGKWKAMDLDDCEILFQCDIPSSLTYSVKCSRIGFVKYFQLDQWVFKDVGLFEDSTIKGYFLFGTGLPDNEDEKYSDIEYKWIEIEGKLTETELKFTEE